MVFDAVDTCASVDDQPPHQAIELQSGLSKTIPFFVGSAVLWTTETLIGFVLSPFTIDFDMVSFVIVLD